MRTRVISLALCALFLILAVALLNIQIFRHHQYFNLSQNNRIRLVALEGQRGVFYDRNGVLLVGNRPSFDIIAIPQEFRNSPGTASVVGGILGITPAEVLKNAQKNYLAPFIPVTIREDVDKAKAIALEEAALRLPGVMVKVSPRREYKFGSVGSPIFGYLGQIDRAELARLKGYGYQVRDYIGKAGLEKLYDTYLRGRDGGMQLEVNNRGFSVKSLGKSDAAPGKDLTLTIDIRLQAFAEKLFDDTGRVGASVVMDPRTGAILALASKPDYDPNLFCAIESSPEKKALLARTDLPMFDRAITGLYPPGSVFKPVTAAAGLERRKINADTVFYCHGAYELGGNSFACWDKEGHREQTVVDALKNSCNVFFYQAGRAVGIDDLYLYATRFGYGSPTGIDLPDEACGLTPNRTWKRLSRKQNWFEGDTLNCSIGQGYVLVTPLQVARMMAAIANGGDLVQPYIVKKIDGVEVSTVRARATGISKETLGTITKGLRKVVEDKDGTGRRARVEGLSVAGKTGTAQNPRGISHAWFSGFAPVENAQIAVVVFVEHGGKGGLDAAEFGGKILKMAKELGLLEERADVRS